MILDLWLNEVAKSINGEANVTPAYFAVATGVVVVAPTDTTMTGEFGTRFAMSKSRSSNQISATGIRSSASVLQATGDTLTGLSSWSAISSGTILSEITLPSLVQTTAFDIQFDMSILVTRQ